MRSEVGFPVGERAWVPGHSGHDERAGCLALKRLQTDTSPVAGPLRRKLLLSPLVILFSRTHVLSTPQRKVAISSSGFFSIACSGIVAPSFGYPTTIKI